MLRGLPSIDRLLSHPLWAEVPHVPHLVRRAACRALVQQIRERVLASKGVEPVPPLDEIARLAVDRAVADVEPLLQAVVNATGVLIHTNLGRSPLPKPALEAINSVAGRYTNLEMDLDSGVRDSRHGRLGSAFARILDCGDVVVVNNNASAVYLALASLSKPAKVVISRGEQVEIGGSFRMPDIMDATGAQMVEVGATNRTHLRDYEAAIDGGANVLMKVHRSNFRIIGFTAEVSVDDLAALGRERGVITVYDLGSGLMKGDPNLSQQTVRSALDAGVDLVLFSGDKLLGGPQCGIAAGRPDLVAAMRKHPTMRMLRPGKLTLLALEATLLAWERDPQGGEIPVSAMLSVPMDRIQARAEALAAQVTTQLGERADVSALPVDGRAGGGTLPEKQLPSWAVSIRPLQGSEESLAAALRQGKPSVVARREDGRVLLDVRTLFDGDEDLILQALGRW